MSEIILNMNFSSKTILLFRNVVQNYNLLLCQNQIDYNMYIYNTFLFLNHVHTNPCIHNYVLEPIMCIIIEKLWKCIFNFGI